LHRLWHRASGRVDDPARRREPGHRPGSRARRHRARRARPHKVNGAGVKLRIRFTKLGKVRFTSHRDIARMWERAFRRTGVALAYTAGFSPRPKISFGLALPTGHESVAEYLDVELAEDGPPDIERVVGAL